MHPKKNIEPLRNNRPSMKIRSIAFALLILGVAACNAFSRGSGGSDPFARFRVVVQADSDCRVTACVSITSLRFLAVPIGSLRASAIQEITVAPGDTAVLTIPPV